SRNGANKSRRARGTGRALWVDFAPTRDRRIARPRIFVKSLTIDLQLIHAAAQRGKHLLIRTHSAIIRGRSSPSANFSLPFALVSAPGTHRPASVRGAARVGMPVSEL